MAGLAAVLYSMAYSGFDRGVSKALASTQPESGTRHRSRIYFTVRRHRNRASFSAAYCGQGEFAATFYFGAALAAAACSVVALEVLQKKQLR